MSLLSPVLRHKRISTAVVCALLAAAVFLAFHHPKKPLNPNIATPAMAIDGLEPKSLYYTISAHDYLAKNKPAWIAARDNNADRADFARAEQEPTLWRQLDHKYHFDVVLLCGDPSEYEKLLEHLIQTRDWTLTYLDHTSLVFKRAPAKPWTANAFRDLVEKFSNYPDSERAVFLTQLAAKLLSVGQIVLAKQQLDESVKLDAKSPETWTQFAAYESLRGKWDAALENINRALEIDPDYSHAISTKAQVLYSAKRFNDALRVSEKLVEDSPDDPNVLFFHAKIAHDSHAYNEEIPTLKHLIEIVEKQHQPTAGFRIYLGQAYARDGQAAASLDQFEKARDEGGLSKDQQKFVDDAIRMIKTRTSL